MSVLIVESQGQIGSVWARHLQRIGFDTQLVHDEDGAVQALIEREFDVIIMDAMMEDGSSFTVADFAGYRRPNAKIIFVTSTSFFSDGSIFRLIPNTCAFIQRESAPEDIAAMVEHYGRSTLAVAQ